MPPTVLFDCGFCGRENFKESIDYSSLWDRARRRSARERQETTIWMMDQRIGKHTNVERLWWLEYPSTVHRITNRHDAPLSFRSRLETGVFYWEIYLLRLLELQCRALEFPPMLLLYFVYILTQNNFKGSFFKCLVVVVNENFDLNRFPSKSAGGHSVVHRPQSLAGQCLQEEDCLCKALKVKLARAAF